MKSSQPQANIFFQPNSLGALPLWLQAKLTISLTSIQDKVARLFMSIAAELWVRGAIDTVEDVFRQVAATSRSGWQKSWPWKLIIIDHTGWQLNPTGTGYLDVQCTGLGGRELDKE